MNYIDLTSDKVFTDDQINRRLQSAIRSRVSQDDELKAARLGRKSTTNRSATEKAHIKRVDDHIAACLGDVTSVQIDNALLRATLAHEAAVTRIAEPALNPLAKDAGGNLLYPDVPSSSITAKGKLVSTTVTNPAIVRDTDERKAAQATIKAATPEVVALYTKRDAARVAAVKINAV